ncbi:MAG: GYF domain-containing protein, partial [Acidobacteriota bacterium]
MKIICDNCRTKYSIADEKVKGKVFKIRCKKCQNIIVVRGNEGDVAGASADDGDAAEAPDAAAMRPQDQAADAPAWHLVIGREQVGPMTAAEVRDRFGRGEIDVESYIWKEGFADWQRLTAVPEFADLGQATAVAPSAAAPAPAAQEWQAGGGAAAAWSAPADAGWAGAGGGGGSSEDTARADAANLFGGSLGDPGRDLFASQHGQEAFSSAQPEAAPVESNLFGAAPSAPAGGDLFPAASGGNGGQQLFPAEEPAGG